VEKRAADDRKPKLSDLRESGEIEQTADLVLFIHRDDYGADPAMATAHQGLAKLIISKQRNGPTGEIDLIFKKDISKFESADLTSVPAVKV